MLQIAHDFSKQVPRTIAIIRAVLRTCQGAIQRRIRLHLQATRSSQLDPGQDARHLAPGPPVSLAAGHAEGTGGGPSAAGRHATPRTICHPDGLKSALSRSPTRIPQSPVRSVPRAGRTELEESGGLRIRGAKGRDWRDLEGSGSKGLRGGTGGDPKTQTGGQTMLRRGQC